MVPSDVVQTKLQQTLQWKTESQLFEACLLKPQLAETSVGELQVTEAQLGCIALHQKQTLPQLALHNAGA